MNQIGFGSVDDGVIGTMVLEAGATSQEAERWCHYDLISCGYGWEEVKCDTIN
jgi:hypothetical protein